MKLRFVLPVLVAMLVLASGAATTTAAAAPPSLTALTVPIGGAQ